MSGDVQVLARIDSSRFYDRPEDYREEVRAWLTANGIDYNRVLCSRDVEVVLLDAPAIVREEKVIPDGAIAMVTYGPGDRLLTAARPRTFSHVVHSLLRVPLPEHLADPA